MAARSARTAAAQGLAEDLAGRIVGLGPIMVDRMFGGAALRAGGTVFALILDGTAYLRVDDASRPDFVASGMTPFCYTTRVRAVTVDSYWQAPPEVLEDDELLAAWAMRAWRAARAAPARSRRSR